MRNAFAGEYWGFDGLSAVQPRTIVTGCAPLLIGLFLWSRSRKYFPAFFGLLGGIANFHPVSGFHLAQLTGTAHLVMAKVRSAAVRDVLAGAALFAAAAAPFIVTYFPATENVTDARIAPEVRGALKQRFDYAFLPQGPHVFLSVAFHASFGIAVLLWLRRRGGWTGHLRHLVLMGGIALGLGFIGIAAIQGWACLTNQIYLDFEQLRITKFIYLPLLAAFPMTYRVGSSSRGTRRSPALD